jgi:GTP pyrophosphokinase
MRGEQNPAYSLPKISMSIEHRPPTQEKENKLSFLRRLEGMSWNDREQIMFAYDLSKSAHRTQYREGGERYFEHPREVALILMDECHITKPSPISAAFLHDAMEDTSIFGSYQRLSYSEWKDIARFRISKAFDEHTADMIIDLTKPKIDHQEVSNGKEGMTLYITNLRQAHPDTLLVKMADRLHNLRTLQYTSPEKQSRKIAETQDIYLPLFQRVLTTYPEEGRYLLNEMEKTIQALTHQPTL